jgi:hypothetical protein
MIYITAPLRKPMMMRAEKMQRKIPVEGKNDKTKCANGEQELNMQKLWKSSKYWFPMVESIS